MATYTRRVVGGTALVFFMTALSSVFAYLIRMFLARKLSPDGYGLFYAVFTLVMFFLFFRNLGLGKALVKYIPEFQIKKKFNDIKTAIFSVLTFQIISSLILGGIFLLFSNFLAKNYFKNDSAAIILNLFVLYIVLSVFFILLKDILHGFQKVKFFAPIESIKLFIVLSLILLFFYFGLGVFSPVLAYTIVCPILFLILLPSTLKTFNIFKYKIKNFKSVTKKMFLFGIPVLVGSVGGKIIGYIDTLILTYFMPLSEVGIYNVVLPSAIILITLGSSVSSIIFPMTSELWAKKDKKRLSEGLRLMHKYAFVITAPLIFTGFAFSALFIRLFFGSEYVSGSLALQILLIGVLLYIVAGINNNIISGIGKPKTVTIIILFTALFNTILNLFLIPRYGINGAAIATSASYLLVLIFSTYKVTKYIKIKFPYKAWSKSMFSAIVFVLGIFFIKEVLSLNPWFELIISVAIAGLVYLAIIYFLKVIDLKEIKHYLSLLKINK